MESFKEFYFGLIGYHEINPETNELYSPTLIRKLIGIILVFNFIGPMLYIGASGLVALVISAFAGNWILVLGLLFGIPMMIGLQSIFGWAIIDWDKRRILENISKAASAS